MSGALRLGPESWEGRLPLFEMSGIISSTGDFSMSLAASAFVPLPEILPGLSIAAMSGSVELRPDGGMTFDVFSHNPDELSPFGQALIFTDLESRFHFDKQITDRSTAFLLKMSGTMRLGGDSGVEVSYAGGVKFGTDEELSELSLADLSMELELHHPGGWAPMAGMVSPAFDSALAL